MDYKIKCDTEDFRISMPNNADLMQEQTLKIGKNSYKTKIITKNEKNEISRVLINNKLYAVKIKKNADGSPYKIFINGREHDIQVEQIASTRFKPQKQKFDGNIFSSLPGQITKIFVETGKSVKKGDILLILEAMKMQNEVTAPSDGKIGQLLVQEGESVAKNQLIVKIEV